MSAFPPLTRDVASLRAQGYSNRVKEVNTNYIFDGNKVPYRVFQEVLVFHEPAGD